MAAHIVVGVDVPVDGAHGCVAEGQQEDIDVEHPVKVGEYFRSMLKKRERAKVATYLTSLKNDGAWAYAVSLSAADNPKSMFRELGETSGKDWHSIST